MTRTLRSFKIRSGRKVFDYRLGKQFDLAEIKNFFQKEYEIEKIWSGPRHVFGILIKKGKKFFLKLATSEGISLVTKKEFLWNNYFYKYFPKDLPFDVPKNFARGFYKKTYFYLVCNYIEGRLLCPLKGIAEQSESIVTHIPDVIKLAEEIQKLPLLQNPQPASFFKKTENWFYDIPFDVRKNYDVNILMGIVKEGVRNLSLRPRHGDFTPWHMIEIEKGKLVVLDGEHWQSDSVEHYDICYFIQRVFSVLKKPVIAKKIYKELLKKGYLRNKLRIVLSARAIGGFLDDYISGKENYLFAKKFMDWVLQS